MEEGRSTKKKRKLRKAQRGKGWNSNRGQKMGIYHSACRFGFGSGGVSCFLVAIGEAGCRQMESRFLSLLPFFFFFFTLCPRAISRVMVESIDVGRGGWRLYSAMRRDTVDRFIRVYPTLASSYFMNQYVEF